MIYPICYTPDETNFRTNGTGVLSDCLSCIKKANILTNEDEITLKYPANGIHAEWLTDRAIIKCHTDVADLPAVGDPPGGGKLPTGDFPTGGPQLYRIYSHSKSINGIVTYRAAHITYDLDNYICLPFKANNSVDAAAGIASHTVGGLPFEVRSLAHFSGTFLSKVPSTVQDRIFGDEGSLKSSYPGEFIRRNFRVSMTNRIGTNRGKIIRYGHNMTKFKDDLNSRGVHTGIYPYWADDSGKWVGGGIVKAPNAPKYDKILPVNLTTEFDDLPTYPSYEQVRAAGEKWVQKNQILFPRHSLKVGVSEIPPTNHPYNPILLGDTVTVIFAEMGFKALARAIEIEYNCLEKRVESMIIGNSPQTLTDVISNLSRASKSKTPAAQTRSF